MGRQSHIDVICVGYRVLVKTLVAKEAHALSLFKVLAVPCTHSGEVIIDELVLRHLFLHPKRTGTYKVRPHATFGASSRHLIGILCGMTPCANALEAEHVVAAGQDAETLISSLLLHDRLEANAALLVLGPGEGAPP